MRRVIPPLAASVAAVVLFTGCGSKSNSSTSATVDWANNLCTAITTWKTSVDSAVKSVNGGNVSKSSLRNAADEVESATETFVDSVKKLGKPKTTAGTQAKTALDQFSTQISNERDKINAATSGVTSVSGIIAAAPTVLESLKTMRTDVSTTYKQLQTLDASGELSKAFKQANACTTLTKSG
jgi:hypothetical protein